MSSSPSVPKSAREASTGQSLAFVGKVTLEPSAVPASLHPVRFSASAHFFEKRGSYYSQRAPMASMVRLSLWGLYGRGLSFVFAVALLVSPSFSAVSV